MELFLPLFLLIPLTGFVASLFIPKKMEKALFYAISIPSGVQTILAIVFTISWSLFYDKPLIIIEITLYNSEHYKFFIDLFFDQVTATYLIMSSILTFMISHYSKVYMHKDEGYKRYFNNMLMYYFGIQVIIFSGNFETLFIGWEILGVSSFLLIAYYRNRYLPVRNGFKVFSTYRLADIGILLSMWLMHHVFHQNISFHQLKELNFDGDLLNQHPYIEIIITFFIFLAAFVKSAQFPFSSWLPKAMEGPTPSSSIFYGSIAVHIGIYLLLRTYPFWEGILIVKIGLIAMGLISGFIASAIAKVQFSIKAQIAYSSIAQIGLMMVEVALGFETLALIHLTGNALLRSYQLLVSPSVLTYMLRDQFFNLSEKQTKPISNFKEKIRNTMYVFAFREFYMDNFIYKYLWFPVKKWGGKFSFLSTKLGIVLSVLGFSIATYLLNTGSYENFKFKQYLPDLFGMIALAFVLRAFTIRKHPFGAWILLILNHFWIALAVSFNEHFSYWETFYYLLGIIEAGIVGFVTLILLNKKEKFSLDDYYGHAQEHKILAVIFLISCLALMGFPITTTFLGEDLLFSHIHLNQVLLMTIVSLNFIIAGIAIMRIYSRIFMGPNHKWYNSEARRSA